ncbi:preprotein translocase subunit YajC [Novosphingobium album (ex Liu et al. 2023)]|uniref:Preprotein translocase subunit YajC n=1 Tax=Novosphingobium album (ex Liu et al. 2023) TaxID=3031130 RepID=A0ABT5WUJ2_9SPHN|nr:preprotein translocase subunit YajC [Novosphingobium album (ex Liu et al. 2023)]MDE8653537.1 preprotein translocase subunit YajC [Novosphingobium album (ex Liu et al. 2023)]
MTTMSRNPGRFLALAALAACALPSFASAQSIGYGDLGGSGASGSPDGDEADAATPREAGRSAHGPRSRRGAKAVEIVPYIEAAQVVDAELSPGDEVLTYSRLAAGVDAGVSGQHNAAAVSLRYERRFGWGKKAEDSDFLSGVARGYTTITPGVTIEAGGLATRSSVEQVNSALASALGDNDAVTQVYSVYAGPSLATRAGDVTIGANYRFGYTRVEQPDAYVPTPGAPANDIFDHSTVHVADVEAGVAPGTVLPVGLGAAGSFYQEDISNLDQRVRDMQARAIVTVPLSRTVQATGALGYEDVEISSRDAVRDATGAPVIGKDGRYKTDKSAPRVLAYDTDGLIWDVGVMWRPSPRTSLTAHVGRRYGSTSYTGTLTYMPTRRSTLSLAVYDNIAGFGGQVNRAIGDLPTDFDAVRDPLSGDLRGCVASLQGNNCLSGALGSVRSATFRARGVVASYAVDLGRITTGVGAGYDRRKFIAAPGTILASANGTIDENYWLAAYLNGEIDQHSGFSTNLYANWLKSGDVLFGDTSSLGATAAYYRTLTDHLHATAAVGIDGTTYDDGLIDDLWTASALVGLRYSF